MRVWSNQSIVTSDEEFKYDTWDIFLSSLKHASIDLCTRVPKNCKYTELELYFTVYVYVVYFV